MKNFKLITIWVLGILITLGAAAFQRITGPTNPLKEKVVFSGKTSKLKLPSSLDTKNKDGFLLKTDVPNVSGIVHYRVYPSNDVYTADTLLKTEEGLLVPIAAQKAAGKITYKITLTDGISTYESPFVTARYKNPVPAVWLILHIILMFTAMLLAVVAGLKATFNSGNYSRMLFWSGILLFLGGMIFGCIVQKFAFGVYWSGIPSGLDLTDNKTLLVLLMFGFAIWKNFKKPSRMYTIIAVVVLLLVYSIPHSLFGSELDPKTGELTTATTTPIK